MGTSGNSNGLPKTILVKFHFSNAKLIPASVRECFRKEEDIQDRQRSLGQGSHSEAQFISVDKFMAQALKNGYCIADVHFFRRKKKWNHKFVLVIVLNCETKEKLEISQEVKKCLVQLVVKDAWKFLHLYNNPNGVMSMELLHRAPDQGNQEDIGEVMFADLTSVRDDDIVLTANG